MYFHFVPQRLLMLPLFVCSVANSLSFSDLIHWTQCTVGTRWRLILHSEISKKPRLTLSIAKIALAAWKSVTAFSKKWGGMWETWLNVSMKRWVSTLFGRASLDVECLDLREGRCSSIDFVPNLIWRDCYCTLSPINSFFIRPCVCLIKKLCLRQR